MEETATPLMSPVNGESDVNKSALKGVSENGILGAACTSGPATPHSQVRFQVTASQRGRKPGRHHTASSSSNRSSSSGGDSVTMERKAPDGGWGWMVVAAAFTINMIADGVCFSFGVFFVEFLDYFGSSKSTTAWLGSIFLALPLLLGPMASSLVDRFGCRRATIAGALISTAGFLLSYFVDSFALLFFTFSIIPGIGLSVCYVTAVVIVAYYFEKRRSLATGISVCGTGVGTFVFAPLVEFLIQEYSWRGSVLILSGIFLNMVVCGMLMRDLTWTKHKYRERWSQASLSGDRDSDSGNSVDSLPDIERLKQALQSGDCWPLNQSEQELDRLHSSDLQLPTWISDTSAPPPEVCKQIASDRRLYELVVRLYPHLLPTGDPRNMRHPLKPADRNWKKRDNHRVSTSEGNPSVTQGADNLVCKCDKCAQCGGNARQHCASGCSRGGETILTPIGNRLNLEFADGASVGKCGCCSASSGSTRDMRELESSATKATRGCGGALNGCCCNGGVSCETKETLKRTLSNTRDSQQDCDGSQPCACCKHEGGGCLNSACKTCAAENRICSPNGGVCAQNPDKKEVKVICCPLTCRDMAVSNESPAKGTSPEGSRVASSPDQCLDVPINICYNCHRDRCSNFANNENGSSQTCGHCCKEWRSHTHRETEIEQGLKCQKNSDNKEQPISEPVCCRCLGRVFPIGNTCTMNAGADPHREKTRAAQIRSQTTQRAVTELNIQSRGCRGVSSHPGRLHVRPFISCDAEPSAAYLRNIRLRRQSMTYRGAMLHIHRYRLRASSCPDIYRNSMITILSDDDDEGWWSCCSDVLHALRRMVDISYFKLPAFTLFSISNFVLYMFYDVPYVYLADHAIAEGTRADDASVLISVIGATNVAGVLLIGYVGDKPWVNSTALYVACMVGCGVATLLVPTCSSYRGLLVLSALFGFCISANYTLAPTILVDLITIDNFTNAYGLLLLVQGVANLIGPPLCGWMRDLTGSYDLTFHASGAAIIFSGLLLCVLQAVSTSRRVLRTVRSSDVLQDRL